MYEISLRLENLMGNGVQKGRNSVRFLSHSVRYGMYAFNLTEVFMCGKLFWSRSNPRRIISKIMYKI